jgi:hypothetical protein
MVVLLLVQEILTLVLMVVPAVVLLLTQLVELAIHHLLVHLKEIMVGTVTLVSPKAAVVVEHLLLEPVLALLQMPMVVTEALEQHRLFLVPLYHTPGVVEAGWVREVELLELEVLAVVEMVERGLPVLMELLT